MLERLWAGLAGARLYPITPRCLVRGRRPATDVAALTIATWNVAWGQGWGSELSGSARMRSRSEQADALAKMGRWLAEQEVDVALLQEVDVGAARSGFVDQAE